MAASVWPSVESAKASRSSRSTRDTPRGSGRGLVRETPVDLRHPLLRAAAFPTVVLAAYLVVRACFGEAADWPPFNVATHVAGGLAVAHLAGVALAPVLAALRGRTRMLVQLIGIFALTATVAVSWEFFECLVARLYGVRGPSAGGDTLRDIAAGMSGALAYLATRPWIARCEAGGRGAHATPVVQPRG